MGSKPADLIVAVDPGTTTTTVCWKWSTSQEKHHMKFSTQDSEKTSEELDATIARSHTKWYYGLDVRFLSDVVVFGNIKLGLLDREPYSSLLTSSFETAAKDFGEVETPVTLLGKLFSHILEILEEQYLDPPESERFRDGRNFRDISKHCWVTYPVRRNESLKIVLIEAALAAGFRGVNGVSESMSAASYVGLKSTDLTTMLIIDCGGGSTDAAAVYMDIQGAIKQACATDGFDGGGQTINDAARAYLQQLYPENTQLKDDSRWASISLGFDGCKRVFDGKSPVKLELSGEIILIQAAQMKRFFRPLIRNILELFRRQFRDASKIGHTPEKFILCGGPARNRWFRERVFKAIRNMEPRMTCAEEVRVGTVAMGALAFADDSPVTEMSVAGQHIGFTYLDDRTISGKRCRRGKEEEGIGWVFAKGIRAGPESRVELLKTITRRRSDLRNQLISSRIYRTTERFNGNNLQRNHRNTWDCDITYPIRGSILAQLDYLGTVEAEIPHDDLFPPGSTHAKVNACFIFSIRPEGELLKVEVFLKQQNGTLRMIDRSYKPAACWLPKSELDLESQSFKNDTNNAVTKRSIFPADRAQRYGQRDRAKRKWEGTSGIRKRSYHLAYSKPALLKIHLARALASSMSTSNTFPSSESVQRTNHKPDEQEYVPLPPRRSTARKRNPGIFGTMAADSVQGGLN